MHWDTSLGSYQNSPFVTGSNSYTNGLKTEILDYEGQQWNEAKRYPYSWGDRYAKLQSKIILAIRTINMKLNSI